MKVLCFPTAFPPGPYAEKMYIIYCEKTLDAVIVDPGLESFEMVLETIRQHSLKPVAIWLTHSHWDHIVDVAKIKREFSLPIYIHEEDRGNLEKPGSDGVPIAIPTVEGTTPDHMIKDGDILQWVKLSSRLSILQAIRQVASASIAKKRKHCCQEIQFTEV